MKPVAIDQPCEVCGGLYIQESPAVWSHECKGLVWDKPTKKWIKRVEGVSMPEATGPQCPSCGYTEEDAKFNMDHHLCKNSGNAPWEKKADLPYRAAPPSPEGVRGDREFEQWFENYHPQFDSYFAGRTGYRDCAKAAWKAARAGK